MPKLSDIRSNRKAAGPLRFIGSAWGQITSAGVALLSIRIYTEILTATQFGIAMIALGIIALIDSASSMALNQTILSTCSKYENHEDQRKASVGISFHALKIFAIPIAAIFALATLYFVIVDGKIIIILAATLLPIYLCSEFSKYSLLSLLLLRQKQSAFSTWMVGEAALTSATTIASISLFSGSASSFLCGYVLGRVASTAVFISVFSKNHFADFFSPVDRGLIKLALRHGTPIAAMGPLGWISTYLDRYIIGALLGPAATGIYTACTGIASRPYAVLTATLTNYFRPQYYEYRSDRPQARRSTLKHWSLSAVVIGGSGVALFYILGNILAGLMLARDYRSGAVTIFVLFACAQTFSVVTHASDNALISAGRGKQLLAAQSLISACSLLFLSVGIIMHGIIGGLIARCISEAIKMCITFTLALTILLKESTDTSALTAKS